MLTPAHLSGIADGAVKIAEDLHVYLIRQIVERMMIRLGRGEKYLLTSSDRWRIQILQDAGYLLQDITAELQKYTKLQAQEIRDAFQDAGVRALAWDDEVYKAAGLSPVPLWQSPHLVRLMERNYYKTLNEWKNFTGTTAEEARRLFINECDFAYHKVSTGAVSYSQAVREAIDAVCKNGVEIRYPSGHVDQIEVAVARAVRTGVAQAAGDISLRRMMEMGWGHILTSSHMGARPTHEVWQGQVFSVDWDEMRRVKPSLFSDMDDIGELPPPDRNYPEFVETCQYGDVTGICGANCRHSFSGWMEGMNNPFKDYDSEENKKLYELEQRQRLLERRIRKTKRDLMGWQASVENAEDDALKADLQKTVDRKSALLKKQNEEYREFCGKNNLRTQTERLQIAKWNREQANKAIAAARRYEKEKGK